MNKISFVGSAALGVTCVFIYLCAEAIEQVSMNLLSAYMATSQVGFASDMFHFDFLNLKLILIVMAIIFFGLAISSLFSRK